MPHQLKCCSQLNEVKILFYVNVLKILKPKPCPSEAPSIIPGISAIVSDFSEFSNTPNVGINVSKAGKISHF